MSTGLKVWLWIMLVLHVNSTIMRFALVRISAASLVLEIIIIIGIVLLLFKKRKLGFYIILSVCIVGFIIFILSATNDGIPLLSAVISPTIIYLLMRKNWNEFK